MDVVSNFAFPLFFKDKEIFEEVRKQFLAENVEIRPIIAGNMALQPFFKQHFSGSETNLPNATLVHAHGFYFGNRHDLTDEELSWIATLL